MSTRIPIKYSSAWSWLLTMMLLPPRVAFIDIDGERIRVHMGWAFHTTFTRADIRAVNPNASVVSIGAHGWNGRWLVNGASAPIAAITLVAPVRAWVLGVPVHLRELLVSVDDVAQLQGALLT